MAITINQDVTGTYPAYNDSFIKFSSDISPTKAEIVLEDSIKFPNPFLRYPDANGEFVFNLKEIAKASFLDDRFSMPENTPNDSDDWARFHSDSIVEVFLTITTFNGAASDSIVKSYRFSKSTIQVGETLFESYLMYNTKNGLDYEMIYFEGYPFTFTIGKIESNSVIRIKNKNSSIETDPIVGNGTTGSMDIYVSKGSMNWVNRSFLPLYNSLNKLEVSDNGNFKANIVLQKEPAKSGVYLRWFNNKGAVSYYLFDEYFSTDIRNRSNGNISRNDFSNAGSLTSRSLSIGKETSKALQIRASIEAKYIPLLDSLLSSPNVEMYNSFLPFEDTNWIGVEINDNVSHESKLLRSEYSFTLILPNQLNLSL